MQFILIYFESSVFMKLMNKLWYPRWCMVQWGMVHGASSQFWHNLMDPHGAKTVYENYYQSPEDAPTGLRRFTEKACNFLMLMNNLITNWKPENENGALFRSNNPLQLAAN